MSYQFAEAPQIVEPVVVQKVWKNIQGVDFRKEDCDDLHSPDMQNMYRDYRSNSDAIVTFPGFREINKFPSKVSGIFRLEDKVFVHCGGSIYRASSFDTPFEEWEKIYDGTESSKRPQMFVFNKETYCFTGNEYLKLRDSEFVPVGDVAYIPTTYRVANQEQKEFEQRNILTPKFKNGFRGDGTTTKFTLSERNLDSIDKVSVNDVIVTEGFTEDLVEGTITFDEAPSAPSMEGQYNIVVEPSKVISGNGAIDACDTYLIFDNRVFATGNPATPNRIYFSKLNDPTHFGIYDRQDDGNGLSPIKNLVKVGQDTFAALKSDTMTDAMIYYHSPLLMENDILPKTYPARSGLAGVGSLGACETIDDDVVFITNNGVKAVGKLNYGMERNIEHRSTLVDNKMQLEKNKETVLTEVWRGFLCVLFPESGHMYLADSRSKIPMQESQNIEYNWFFLAGIHRINEGGTVKITALLADDDSLHMGLEDGAIFRVNTDMIKDPETMELSVAAYNQDGRMIESHYCTPMSDWGTEFNVLKKFEKRGNCARVTTFSNSSFSISVRTDKTHFRDYEQRLVSSYFDWGEWHWDNFTWNTLARIGLPIPKLKEKKWQQAQIKFRSNAINSPFGFFEIDIRARVLNYVKK